MRPSIRILITSLPLLLTSICVVGQTPVADFSGTWAYKSGINTHKVEMLTIKQSGEKIDVTEKYNKDNRLLTYYSDGRGETNTGIDGTTQIKSRTKWTGDTLFMLFERLPPKPPPSVPKQPQSSEANERSDEWSLSKDGNTLTITISIAYKTPFGPRPYSTKSPVYNEPKVHHFIRKQVFKKIK